MVTLTTGSLMGIILNKKQLVSKSFSQQNEYHLSLSSLNGKVNDNTPSRDRKTTSGYTNNNNSVSMEYYRGIGTSNKVVTLLSNGYYRLATPIYGISSISLSLSNLTNYQDDDLIIYYGAYLRCDEVGESYLVKSSEVNSTITINDIDNAQYMMIKNLSENNITIDNIDITYTCSSISNNLLALDKDDHIIDNALVATFNTDHYEISKYNSTSLSSAVKVYIPEYILNGDTLYPVSKISVPSGTFTRNATNLETLYLPETLLEMDNAIFNDSYSTKITSFTLPKNLSSGDAVYFLPRKTLLTLNYQCINYASVNNTIASSNPIETINIAHDVTYLGKLFAGSLPISLTSIHYDGSSSEWDNLINNSHSSWSIASITSLMVFAE